MSSKRFRPLMVRLPPELDDRLREYAKHDERPLSWIVRKALEAWLADRESQQ